MLTEEEVKALQDELATTKAELARLKGTNETLAAELSGRGGRVVELEQAVATREADIASLQRTVGERDKDLSSMRQGLSEAVASYKALVVQANPGVAGLISGDSIAEIDQAVVRAKAIADKVREGLEKELLKTRVPAGAPARTAPDLSTLSPREKIQYGIGGKR
ncbi:MAG: hypothetical protein HY670_08580 [Chloroflexi bacterium]|nr:hypothetical protein [Chloroflexota bacterium]